MAARMSRLHNRLGLRTTPSIFFIAAGVVVVFTLAMGIFPAQVQGAFGTVATFLRYQVGWFFTFACSMLVIFSLGIAVSRYGRLKIGDDDAKPEHTGMAWFGMLFAAGIGAVLMFWGVAEPMNHYANPPLYGTEPFSDTAAIQAMSWANFHFGLHMWALFTVPGLCFGYFTYKRKLPPRVSSAFQPLLGDGIHGPIGKTIDVIAIVSTVFGISVSIGLGALQINSGMNYVFGLPVNGWMQAAILAVITAVGTASVLAGMDKGIKRLSYANIVTAIALLLFVLMNGATQDTVRGIVEAVGHYVSSLPVLSFFNDTFGGGVWSGDWTVFYWAWTVTWAPYVGMFLARISRGRTLRQFVIGTMGLPASFVIIWMGIYGFNAFRLDREQAGPAGGGGGLTQVIVEEGDVEAALFQFLGSFPLFEVTSVVALIVITLFFITSIDSAALVMDSMANGHEDPGPRRQQIFWALSIGAVCAAIVLTSGENGLAALQEVIIVIGFPVMFLGFVQGLMLVQALREDAGSARPIPTRQWKQVLPAEEYHRRSGDENYDLDDFVIRPEYHPGTEPEFDTHQPRTWHWQREQEGQPVLQVALTGGLAAGKSAVAEEFRRRGAVVIDTDDVIRDVLRPGGDAHAEIVRVFGDSVLAADGTIDRDALQELVENNETARLRMYEIVLPEARLESRRLGREAGPDAVVVQDIRDLLESQQADLYDLVIVVEAPAEARVDRMVSELGLDREAAWDRIDSRTTDEDRRAIADEMITNDGSRSDLSEAVGAFWAEHVQPVLDEQDGDRAGQAGAAATEDRDD